MYVDVVSTLEQWVKVYTSQSQLPNEDNTT